MPSAELLTSGDIDEIGSLAIRAAEPLGFATELVDAVEQDRLADKSDMGYALILAAEITERAGDLPGAEVLAQRAVAACQAHRDESFGYPRAFRATLLMRLGRDDEAMAEMKALRPLLSQHIDAVDYICDALESGGRAEIAEQWLTVALVTVLQRRQMLESQHNEEDPAYDQAGKMVFTLARHRYQLRRSLELPHDIHDNLAELLMNVSEEGPGDDEWGDDVEEVIEAFLVLFWPQTEFERLIQRWPELAETHGRTWDEHRAGLQQALVQCSERNPTRLGLLAGAVDELVRYAAQLGGDPADSQIREAYAQHVGEDSQGTPWPPGRNDVCWCGSGLKYKKCCRPRART